MKSGDDQRSRASESGDRMRRRAKTKSAGLFGERDEENTTRKNAGVPLLVFLYRTR